MRLVSLLVFLFSVSVAASNVCSSTGQVVPPLDNTEMWIDLQKQTAISAAQKDFRGFCEWNRMDRGTGHASDNFDSPEKLDLEQYRMLKLAGNRDHAADVMRKSMTKAPTDAWGASMMGHAKLKDVGVSYFSSQCSRSSPSCAEAMAKALATKDLNINYAVPEYISKGPLDVSGSKIAGACAYLSPLSTVGCVSASKELLSVVEIHEFKNNTGIQISPVPLIKETITDPRITKALQRTAISLFSRISSENFKAGDNIFDELSAELIKDGFDNKEARQTAVKILGAIASGGPNFPGRINREEVRNFPDSCKEKTCNLNAIMMSAIAEGMVHADTMVMSKGATHPYTLPKEAQFQCDIGKSYHFWSTAALTDRLISKGYSQSAARAAVFASHLGYQLRSDNRFREKDVPSVPRFGSVENGMRMDMNLASAGTSFGSSVSNGEKSEELKIQSGVIATMEEGSNTPAHYGPFTQTPSQVYDWLGKTGASTAWGYYP